MNPNSSLFLFLAFILALGTWMLLEYLWIITEIYYTHLVMDTTTHNYT